MSTMSRGSSLAQEQVLDTGGNLCSQHISKICCLHIFIIVVILFNFQDVFVLTFFNCLG